MNIIIDTSIMRKDRGFLNSDILLLKKLSKLELLIIHVPWIVYKESTSQNLIDLKSIVGKSINELSSLNRKGVSRQDYTILQKIVKELDLLKSKANTSVHKHWTDFIADSKAILHKIDGEHGKKVMTSYFLGEKPFPSPKSRKDIPDAFIFEAVKTINKNYGDIHFICHDNNLRESVKSNPNCYAFESFSKFYESADFKKIEKEYKKIEHFSDELILLKENVDKIKEFAIKEIYGDVFAGEDQLIVHENIPSDGNEGLLQSMDEVSIKNIYLDKIQFIDGIFYVPLEISACFGIEYFLFKSDYYLYTDERKISIIDHDWNKHYYLVEEIFKVHLSYKCSIEQESIKFEEYEFSSEPAIIEELDIIKK